MVTQEINRILKRYNDDASDIIAILQDVQKSYRYLPQDVMEHIALKLDIPISRIYHLATFFRAFSLEPRGKHEIHVCMGTACHVRGAPRILDVLERELKIPAGKTTADQNFTLETVNCVGACALGPVVVVDGKSKGKLNIQKTERIIKEMMPAAPATKKAGPVKKAAPVKPKKKVAAKPKQKTTPAVKAKSAGPKKKTGGTKKAAAVKKAAGAKKAAGPKKATKKVTKKARR